MLVKIEFTSTAPKEETIDLKDYGYDAEIGWEDLTQEQQYEITDSIVLEYDVLAGGEAVPFDEFEYADWYDDEELELIKEKFKL